MMTRIGTLLAAIGLALGCAGQPAGEDAPGTTGAGLEAWSEQGLYRVAATSELVPLVINRMHVWTLHVTDTAGSPVEGAEVTVDGGMPEHQHGLPTQPEVTADLGGGRYRVEGMKFNMPGYWVVDVEVAAGDDRDTARFEFTIE